MKKSQQFFPLLCICLLAGCSCGHEEIYTIDQLMLHLMQGKWTLQAVLMCNGRTEYDEDIYTDVSLVLIFGDRGYAKEPLTDDEFINAALKGTVTSLWRYRDGGMYIYGYDIG